MPEYSVTYRETLTRAITVVATSPADAAEQVRTQNYRDEDGLGWSETVVDWENIEVLEVDPLAEEAVEP